MTRLADFFAAQSPLIKLLPGYQPRAGQAWMAEAVAETIENHGKLVVEAGTGTGKTFAYLLPAMESGRKTIISTGTKALQDQLFHRDLPLLGKAVGRPVAAALLNTPAACKLAGAKGYRFAAGAGIGRSRFLCGATWLSQ